jgi:MSHA biogenesis protein MshN
MSLINQVLQDLEKRHAAESETNALPPHVRAVQARPRSPVRVFGIVATAVAVVVVAAVAAYAYKNRSVPANNVAAPVSSGPTASPAPDVVPVPAPKEPVAAPAAAQASPGQSSAFNGVSRLSDELSVGAPSARKEKERPVAPPRNSKAVIIPLPEAVLPPLPAQRVETSPAVAVDAPPRAEPAAKPAAPAAERVIPLPPEPVAAADSTPTTIDKQMREVVPSERAEIAFRKGVKQIQEGRANAAELDFRDALKIDPSHSAARQALLGLLLDSKRNNEAEQILRKTLELNPRQPRHAMVLARLEVERGDVTSAINTMVGVLPYVKSDPDFHAFLAALLQREGRHREAVDYYHAALRGTPGNGVWMMGLGISLRASNQSAEARDAFQHAIESRQLSPELQEFVERQLRELSAPKKK